jgi:hypothetical protein
MLMPDKLSSISKIATAVASGQLTMAQTQDFTKELDRINRDEISLIASLVLA